MTEKVSSRLGMCMQFHNRLSKLRDVMTKMLGISVVYLLQKMSLFDTDQKEKAFDKAMKLIGHHQKHATEELSKSLRFHLTRVVVAEPQSEWNGRDLRGENRIFLLLKKGEKQSMVKENDPGPTFVETEEKGQNQLSKLINLKNGIVLEPNRVLFMPAGAPVRWRFAANSLMLGFHFRLELFPGFDIFRLGSQCFRSKHCEPNFTQALLEAVRQDKNLSAQIQVIGQLMELSSQFIDMDREELQRVLLLRQKYADVAAYLESGKAAKHTVEAVAETMQLSTSALNRQFHQDMGMSPKAFLDQYTLQLATQSLGQTQKQIKAISDELGFTSTSYFCRFVRKHTGQSPRRIREQLLFTS